VRCFYDSNLMQIKDKLKFVICFSETIRRKGGMKKRLRKLDVFGEYDKFTVIYLTRTCLRIR
jgi:hypothetical protein